ncbi:hypothetical protein BDR05DRAFT_951952 [Suillus weaverae]|nr:hypothetical protein BDR05DRAFT_951952 [Suillus weaverae]
MGGWAKQLKGVCGETWINATVGKSDGNPAPLTKDSTSVRSSVRTGSEGVIGSTAKYLGVPGLGVPDGKVITISGHLIPYWLSLHRMPGHPVMWNHWHRRGGQVRERQEESMQMLHNRKPNYGDGQSDGMRMDNACVQDLHTELEMATAPGHNMEQRTQEHR